MNKVTVLMAFYNEDPNYVRINIDSILNQTYKNFKFLIISDNPSNNVLNSLAKDYEKEDDRICFLQNEVNLGIPGAKNRGLKVCETEYIAISDADDWFHPERLEKQVNYLDAHPDVMVIGSYGRIIDKEGKPIGEALRSGDDKLLKTMLPFQQPIFHPVMMFRRVINGTPVMYDESMKISLDYEICVRLSDFKFYNIPEFLFDYRISSGQTSQVYSDKYIYYDGPVRKKALRKFYRGVSEIELDAFVSMYYGTSMTKEELKTAYLFINNLYHNNIDNKEVYLDYVMKYFISLYYASLRRNTSFTTSLINLIKLINDINSNRYSGFFYISSRICKKVFGRFLI